MMLFNDVGRSQTTYTPGPATMEGPPHPSPAALEPHQFNVVAPFPDKPQSQPRLRRKRKADPNDAHNERLSKRMSLLNLEQNGQKLYVPVEQPQIPPPLPPPAAAAAAAVTTTADGALGGSSSSSLPSIIPEEPMQLDDTKHKVYIYNIDDELTSEDESDAGSGSSHPREEGRLVFLPDIEKHLRLNRLPVPKPILPNKDGELAGMQLVLYSDGPSSISVPEERDSVRKAILEARARLREKQAAERGGRGGGSPNQAPGQFTAASVGGSVRTPTPTAKPTTISFATPVKFGGAARRAREDEEVVGGPSGLNVGFDTEMITDDDADAMDLD